MNLEEYLSMLHKMAAADKDRQDKIKERRRSRPGDSSAGTNFMSGC